MKLFTDGIVAIDGSKFKAVNNRDKNCTDCKLQARVEQLEDSIKRYLVELDRADRDGGDEGVGRSPLTPNSSRSASAATVALAAPYAGLNAFPHGLGRFQPVTARRIGRLGGERVQSHYSGQLDLV